MSQATLPTPPAAPPTDQASATPRVARRVRRLTVAARGEPASWLMGAALLLSITLIAGLLGLVLYEGLRTFWPRPIDEVRLRSGEVFLGVPTAEESYEPDAAGREAIEALRKAGTLGEGVVDSRGMATRRLYRVGNRDLDQQPFRWVNLSEVESVTRPEWAMLLERDAWGVWLGRPMGLVEQRVRRFASGEAVVEKEAVSSGVEGAAATGGGGGGSSGASVGGPRRVERKVISTEPDGSRMVRERTWIAEGEPATWEGMNARRAEVEARSAEIRWLSRNELGKASERLEAVRHRVNRAELGLADATAGRDFGLAWGAWGAVLAGTVGASVGAMWLRRRVAMLPKGTDAARELGPRVGLTALALLALAGGALLVVERPWSARWTPEAVAAVKAEAERERAEIEGVGEQILAKVRELEAENDVLRLVVEAPTTGGARFAPVRSTLPEEPMRLGQLVRPVLANQLTFAGKVGVYLDRWWELLSDEPREVNTEGGVFPVIFGTVLMTLLLSVIVVPLGVIAALYIREYARQGPLIAFVRIAVNNLAGVPSIVYGVFGLGFFCYTLGGYIDAGPSEAVRLARWEWWGLAAVLGIVVLSCVALAVMSRSLPGTPMSRGMKIARGIVGVGWMAAVGVLLTLVFTTPYFSGFFRHYGAPVMGARGLLWASLTLALLTLPVVIVATEEAISAVPRSMREGSYGCGASKWQTVRRIVLPGAMPGIMTGMILAMARGAGEVAPLMLVGAVKLAPELPVNGQFPFLHLERSFMHLGFHIYDLGFQSPDSEAAKPLVWTTTLILIVVVVLLNLVAVRIRSKLRAKLRGSQF